MIGRVPQRLLLVGIVIAASACDNVSWGSLEIGLRSPGADSAAAPPDSVPAEETVEPSLALGTLLYAGVRDGDMGHVFPVAQITEDGLTPLPSTVPGQDVNERIITRNLRPGRRLTLFHNGVRVGTLEVENGEGTTGPFCGVRARGSGHLQLVPGAAESQRFLALESEGASGFDFETFQAPGSTYDQRVASLNLGAEAIPLVGAEWPPSLLDIRQDLQVLPLSGSQGPAVMATFVHRDALRVGPAPEDAYALMILGEPRGSSFDLTYAWYRHVGRDGKGAPRYFSRLDWDRDGDQEILLEVMGEETRWFAAIERGPDGWLLTYQDPCGTPEEGGE